MTTLITDTQAETKAQTKPQPKPLSTTQPKIPCRYIGRHRGRYHQRSPYQRRSDASGFTLIELLICLSVVGALSALLAPRLMSAMPELVLERQTLQLQSLLANARMIAMVNGRPTIVCPATAASLRPVNARNAASGSLCDPHGNWHTGVNVVLDHDHNGRSDDADPLVFHLAWHSGHGLPPKVQWKSFRNNGQIEFLASGTTNWQNGRFVLCSPTHQVAGRHLIINAAGRSYVQRVAAAECG